MNKDKDVTPRHSGKPEVLLEQLTTAHLKAAADSPVKKNLTTAHLKPAPNSASIQSASQPAPKPVTKK